MPCLLAAAQENARCQRKSITSEARADLCDAAAVSKNGEALVGKGGRGGAGGAGAPQVGVSYNTDACTPQLSPMSMHVCPEVWTRQHHRVRSASLLMHATRFRMQQTNLEGRRATELSCISPVQRTMPRTFTIHTPGELFSAKRVCRCRTPKGRGGWSPWHDAMGTGGNRPQYSQGGSRGVLPSPNDCFIIPCWPPVLCLKFYITTAHTLVIGVGVFLTRGVKTRG